VRRRAGAAISANHTAKIEPLDHLDDKARQMVRIPIQSGQAFRFDVGRRSDLMSATIPK
jgi:hypothetical protein